MKLSFKKKTKQRIVSFATAFVMFSNALPMGWLSDIISPLFSISASAAEDDFSPSKEAADFISNGNGITFSNTSDFIDFCYYYYYNTEITVDGDTVGFAAYHRNDILKIGFVGGSEISTDFLGLGTSEYPFHGTLRFGGADYQINAHRALFNYVYDSVQLLLDSDGSVGNIVIKRLSDVADNESHSLLADHVIHDGSGTPATSITWKVELNSSNEKTYSGVIGEIESSAVVDLTFNSGADTSIESKASASDTEYVADVGAVCGVMRGGSTLKLNYTGTNSSSITSLNGNAGGLVGTIEDNSTLTINNMPSALSSNVTASSAYAGGLVGELTSKSTIDNQPGNVFTVSGAITGSEGAGGIFGHYTNYKTEFDLANYNNSATVDGKYCGGVFGVLENTRGSSADALSLTIKNTNSTGTLAVNSGAAGDTTGYFGGIAGKYTTDYLENSLVLNGLTLTAEAKAVYSAFGGAIGIADSSAYIQTAGTVTINAKGTNKAAYFGGLVGATSAGEGVFVDLSDFTLNNNNEQFKGGGVVGLFNNGVLRLSGTTDMTSAKPQGALNCGQLVGNNDNVLIYALGNGSDSGWTFKRCSGAAADDLGTWGEVVRISGVETNIVEFNGTKHTVELKPAVISMSTPAEFVKTALNIQLNQGSDYGCLLFAKNADDEVDSANTRATLLASTGLKIDGTIDLSGTGITGFMRDGGAVTGTGNIGSFTGTLAGANGTGEDAVKLAVGESYGIYTSGQTEGIGQIYRHKHNGLFSVLAGTVESLTVDGAINTHSCVDGMNIGGVAARNGGNVTLTGITSKVTVNDYGDIAASENNGKNIGGFIGFVGTNGTITINGKSYIYATFNLSGKKQSWNTYGGAIGKITAGTFTVNVGVIGDDGNKLTNSLKTAFSGPTVSSENGDGGGLIGYITNTGSYANRKVSINNLEYVVCEIVNAATTNGGGFLGYAWLNTTAAIDGLTVTSGTINNQSVNGTKTATNVGAMLYSATGKMVVNSLEIKAMTMQNGASGSLGMIVNKAFYEANKGLYLDVLNSGYKLNSKAETTTVTDPETDEETTVTVPYISLPSNIGIYDEIAAYSADTDAHVLSGAYGVVSINMSGRNSSNPNIKPTGTYQNQLKSVSSNSLNSAKYANSKTRYYYDLDIMNNEKAAQNLLLWSVNKYAASNISDEFKSGSGSDTTFGTTLDKALSGTDDMDEMKGLSFYPLSSAAADYTIGDLTLNFDYSGIYNAEKNTNNTDSYNRDPGAANQHYLMHSGLFIGQPAGNSITINGTLSLAGTFLEDSTHKGVLISGTMYGKVTVGDDGSIVLDGIKPMNGSSSYKDGYLLINDIKRLNETVDAPSLTIKNLSSTSSYSSSSTYSASGSTDTVAKSLIGPAEGTKLNITFSKIKLDSRNGKSTDDALKAQAETLFGVYGTYNSIFTDSTLMASIHTDQSATLEYNYSYDEDWGTGNRNVTYGKEVKDSKEYIDEENQYYDYTNRKFTNPISSSNTNAAYNFSSGFLPYVAHDYVSDKDENGWFYREIKVNVMAAGLTKGCGTYNDPYIITNGKQLQALAALLQTNGKNTDLSSVNLPKEEISGVANNAKGDRWCTDKDTAETGSSDYHALYKADSSGYKSGETGADDWDLNNVKYYLANAYYKIEDNITLSTFSGLGGTEANLAFRGVIVGDVDDSGAPKYTITNNSDAPLINVSNGSVIKNVNVVVGAESIARNQDVNSYTNNVSNAYFGYASACKYYGGIFGEIMGGDNIIDNSYVTFSNTTVTLTGNYGTIVPVGGYVGVVVFGALIFKNMNASTVNNSTKLNVVYSWTETVENEETGEKETVTKQSGNLASLTTTKGENKEPCAAIYVNPIIGRVINGYAVNETTQFSVTEDGYYHDADGTARTGTKHSLKNGTKHYSIADINSSETKKLEVESVPSTTSDGVINVPNSQALFILSLITQSCAGTAQTPDGSYNGSTPANYLSLSYGTNSTVYGMSHVAEYSAVGTSESDSTNVSDYNDLVASEYHGDTAANTAVPYIIKHYTVAEVDENTTSTVGGLTQYTGTVDELNGKEVYIRFSDYYMFCERNSATNGDTNRFLKYVDSYADATLVKFTKLNDGTWTISFNDNDTVKYLELDTNKLNISTTPFYFSSITINSNNSTVKYRICGQNSFYIMFKTNYGFGGTNNSGDNGAQLYLYEITEASSTTTYSYTYPARCVTSTKGYYDINLTAKDVYSVDDYTYILPDSFRGLGSVGNYDQYNNDSNNGYKNPFSIKLDLFDGDGCTIDEDIYLSKYLTDNYFNVLHKGENQNVQNNGVTAYSLDAHTEEHGVGLFNSVISKGTKADTNGRFYNFTLSGSVRTAVIKDGYDTTEPQCYDVNDSMLWLSTGGVLGWITRRSCINFESITLDNLKLEGTNYIGGLLATGAAVQSSDHFVTIIACSANDICLKMDGAKKDGSNRPFNAMGAFVGKFKEGKVRVYGTTDKDQNTDLTNFSTVTIKSYDFEKKNYNYTVACGGLVGYSGHGFECYDMKVASSASLETPVKIGYECCGSAGGICALTQPHTQDKADGIAVFKNCTVENINVCGKIAGGIYGGKWNNNWVVQSLTLDNCSVEGDSTNHNTIVSNGSTGYTGDIKVNCAGGLVGYGVVFKDGEPQNITISNCLVSNYNVSAPASGYSGGFVGYADTRSGSATFYIHDSSVEYCAIGQTGKDKDYCGGAIGGIASKTENKMLGYNIKLDHVTSGSTNRVGTWIGQLNDKTTSIQFTGVAIYGNGFTNNIGVGSISSASFVFADYDGKSKGESVTDEETGEEQTVYPTGVSSYNDTDNVSMPEYPYVNINPQSSMGSGEIISGDGAVLYDEAVDGFSGTGSKTMAARIYSQLGNDTIARRYMTFSNTAIIGDDKINAYMNHDLKYDGDRISTYKTEKGLPSNAVDDFAVVVIANAKDTETTALINRYIQLVTNTATDYTKTSDYYNIDIKTCKYDSDSGKFVVDTTAANHGLTFTNEVFALNPEYADSKSSGYTFTLVDVQFKDPLIVENVDSKIAYHLYVPVYTIKQMDVDFYSAVKTGTSSAKNNSSVNDYSALMSSNGKHIDSLETWITQYFRYSYNAYDINMLLNTNNVGWNNEKSVIFRTYEASTTFTRLPENTYMILVDPNANADKQYHVENLNEFATYYDTANQNKQGWLIELNKFKDSSGESFEVSTFNDMIAKDIIVSETGNLLYKDGTSKDYDVYTIDEFGAEHYYKYDSSDAAKYSLSVSDDYVLNEDYYLSMYIPEADDLYFYEIKAPAELTAYSKYSGSSKNIKVNEKNFYTVIAADLYTQTTSRLSVLPDDQQITATNKKIYVRASTSITINNTAARLYLENTKLYHSFDLSLNRYSETGGVTNDIIGLDKEHIIATYNIGSEADEDSTAVLNKDLQTNYLNIETTEIMSRLIDASEKNSSLEIYAYVELRFDENKLEAEFPQKSSDSTIGVNVAATSNLAYQEDGLAYTSMSVPFDQDSHYYYREAVNSAKLAYTAVVELDKDDKIGNMSQNQSTLGLNGFETDCYQQEYMHIGTEAKYNVSAISETDLAKAEYLRLTISLSKKIDNVDEDGVVTSVEYDPNRNMLTYFDPDILITSGTKYGEDGEGVKHKITESSSKALVVEIPIKNCEVEDNIYSIGVDFKAKTGKNFNEYANYMVTLKAELIYNENGEIKYVTNSGDSDYIIYTNAKVYPTVIGRVG